MAAAAISARVVTEAPPGACRPELAAAVDGWCGSGGLLLVVWASGAEVVTGADLARHALDYAARLAELEAGR